MQMTGENIEYIKKRKLDNGREDMDKTARIIYREGIYSQLEEYRGIEDEDLFVEKFQQMNYIRPMEEPVGIVSMY